LFAKNKLYNNNICFPPPSIPSITLAPKQALRNWY
jgi:hypothetical protein